MSFARKSQKVISRRQFLKGAAALAASAVLSSCQPKSPTAVPPTAVPPTAIPKPTPVPPTAVPTVVTPKAGGNAIMGVVGNIDNLDPFFRSFNNYAMMQSAYDQFLWVTNDLQVEPNIIEEWSASADSLAFTLKVRQGMKFHDGSPVTADDFVKSIMRATVSETGGHMYSIMNVVKEAVAKGNDSVEIVLKNIAAYFIPGLSFQSLIRPGAFDTLKNAEGGSGPFMVKEWVPGDYLDLQKFPDYWKEGRPYLDNVRVRFFQDSAAMVAALEAKTIDMATSLPPAEYERLRAKLKVIRGQDAANFFYFAMNTKRPVFAKKEVRQAIAFAIDKATMCKNVLFGISDPIELAWPKSSFAYFPEFEGMYRYDLDEAKRRLAAAGYPDGISFKCQYTATMVEAAGFAQILAASLAQIGCKMELVPMDSAQLTPLIFEGEGYDSTFSFAGGTQWYPTRITGSSLYRLANNVCWPNGVPPQGWTDGINKADTSLDPAVQKEGMKQVVQTMMDEMWSMPIAFRYTLFGMQDYVEGLGFGIFDETRYHNTWLNK